MNKFLSYNYVLIFILLFIGCNIFNVQDNPHQKHPVNRDLDSIQKKGVLTALINYSSTSYFIYKGNPMGFEYELLKKYVESIGLELEVIPIKNMDNVFEDLNEGVVDVVAANLTITQERLQEVNFTNPIIITKQVLVQRKPDNWKRLSKKAIQNSLLQSPLDLIDKTVVVRKGSSFNSRLKSLSNEIGGKINVKTVNGDITMEQLMEKVAQNKIDYTVADKNIARVNQWYYPNLDANLVLSLDQKIGWVTRNNADSLTKSINNWLINYQKTKQFKMLYSKYFKNQKSFKKRVNHQYYTLSSGQISPYDEMFKKYTLPAAWDWELLASMVYQESHFNNKAIGWGGSFGLMQFMPLTGAKYGVDESSNPDANIYAGVRYLKKLDKIWRKHVTDDNERLKFVLASYNVGPGHVIDAKNLAKKYGKIPTLWKDVSYYLLHKSEPKYYKDDVVKHGYCKGYIVYDYVNEIMERHKHYKSIEKEEVI